MADQQKREAVLGKKDHVMTSPNSFPGKLRYYLDENRSYRDEMTSYREDRDRFPPDKKRVTRGFLADFFFSSREKINLFMG